MPSFARRFFCSALMLLPLAASAQSLVAQEAEVAVDLGATESEPLPTELFDYVARPEAAFACDRVERRELPSGGSVTDYLLVSQTWQEIVWKHSLQVHEPAELTLPKHVILFVTGGKSGDPPKPRDETIGNLLAHLSGCRVAILSQVPNQPLLGDRVEDDLITETWLKYLETGDPNWPLLFPMVKSAVQAMNALDRIAADEWQSEVEGYVISGASKRGWTSWLAPVVDSRIVATAPIVIDVLNFRPQMDHQMATWGAFSEQIADYTRKGLIKLGDESDRERQLRVMMDPFTYRSRVAIPKLQINGTNDPYWVVDANRFYWNELVGPKFVCQIPNAGHGLEGGQQQALATLAAFVRHVATGRELPALAWRTERTADGKFRRHVSCDIRPSQVRLWSATSSDFDFRDERWESTLMAGAEGGGDESAWSADLPLPGDGHVAHYCELLFEVDGIRFSLCTTIESQ